jgi:oligoribonuclease NrnB/cAMP/cGMP phosphodiesterase (DHH superfamily)
MTPTTVLYHANCPDGLAAAFACHQRFGDEARYIPVSYGKPCPEIPQEHNIYIVDFSYAKDTLLALLADRLGRRRREEDVVTVLDHHASAQRDLEALARGEYPGLKVIFDMEESGASLTWKYLRTGGWHPQNDPEAQGLEHSMPTFFKYVRDRDLWRWALPDSKAVSMVYKCLDKDWLSIAQFAQDLDEAEGYQRIVTEGNAMLRYADALVEDQAARVQWGIIGGYRVPFVNTTTLFSEVGDFLCTTYAEAPFAAYYFFRDDGKVQWGLRSHGSIDVSTVAQSFGGGGHAAASGFVTSYDQCMAILRGTNA